MMTAIEEAIESRYWREELAKELLVAQASSGMSVGTFAEAHGLQPERLRRWKRRLDASSAETEMRFLPVQVVEGRGLDVAGAAGRAGVEVVAGDRIVRVAPGFCEETLLRVLKVLESGLC